MACEHDFQPLGAERIYCRRCGEFRDAPAVSALHAEIDRLLAELARLPQPVYLPCTRPHADTWYPPYTITTTTGGTTYKGDGLPTTSGYEVK